MTHLRRRLNLFSALFGATILSATPAILAAQDERPNQWTPSLMMQLKRVGSVQVSPDGKFVAYTVRQAIMNSEQSEYRTHIHLAYAELKPFEQSRQLTQGDKSCDDPQWSPDSKWIAFLSSREGKKNIFLIPRDGGEAIQLTDALSDVSSCQWSPDGKFIAFTALDPQTPEDKQKVREKSDVRVVDDNVKMNRLHVVPVTSPPTLQRESRTITTGNYSVHFDGSRGPRPGYDWSPDSKTIVFSHVKTPHADDWWTADLSLVTVADGTLKPLLSTGAMESSPLFSPDGKQIAFIASDDPPTWGGTRTIQGINVAGGEPRMWKWPETHDGFGRYSELIGWSHDGGGVYYSEVQGTSLRLLSLRGSPRLVNYDLTGMSLGGVSLNKSGAYFGFSWETLDKPSEAYICKAAPGQVWRVSDVHKDVTLPPLGKTEAVRWKSTDGLEIEGLVTYPVGYEKGRKYPLLLVVHGGPMGVFTQQFDGTPTQYPVAAFASRGYAVLRANPRGSSGYGKKFRYANYGDWGGGDFRDLMTGVDHLIAQGIADADRLGVMGWSYGGFMTSWTITQTKRFRAASVGAGVTNLMSFTGTADIPGFLPDYFGGEYWDKLDAYRAHSAMFQVKGVTTPTLIQHGERDERVPLSQGQELYNALKRQGCVTQMVIYPRTPHSIDEPRLLLDCMTRNIAWFDRYLSSANP